PFKSQDFTRGAISYERTHPETWTSTLQDRLGPRDERLGAIRDAETGRERAAYLWRSQENFLNPHVTKEG
ncbi:hypothetical protein ACWD6I_00165, partial [Streptomyces sp. NPDC002454]